MPISELQWAELLQLLLLQLRCTNEWNLSPQLLQRCVRKCIGWWGNGGSGGKKYWGKRHFGVAFNSFDNIMFPLPWFPLQRFPHNSMHFCTHCCNNWGEKFYSLVQRSCSKRCWRSLTDWSSKMGTSYGKFTVVPTCSFPTSAVLTSAVPSSTVATTWFPLVQFLLANFTLAWIPLMWFPLAKFPLVPTNWFTTKTFSTRILLHGCVLGEFTLVELHLREFGIRCFQNAHNPGTRSMKILSLFWDATSVQKLSDKIPFLPLCCALNLCSPPFAVTFKCYFEMPLTPYFLLGLLQKLADKISFLPLCLALNLHSPPFPTWMWTFCKY